MSLTIRAFRLALRALPADFRAAHGAEMEAMVVDELARARGPWECALVRLAAFADLVRRVPYEHWRRRGRPTLQPRGNRMPSVFADLRFAIRAGTRQPTATALVVATLALAVAANTAVFALVDAVFFRSLPYPHASRLVDLNEQAPKWNLEFVGVTYYDFDQWQRNARAFDGMAVWDGISENVSDGSSATRLDGQIVSHDMARVLGITPVLGRTFTNDEHVLNGPHVVMLGYGTWQTRFGGARDVVGKTLRLNSRPFTIVGVLPENVTLTEPTGFWLPLQLDAASERGNYSYEGVARLKPGVTLDQARRDLLRVQEPIWRQFDSTRTVSPRIMPLRDRFVADYRTVGAALGAGVVLVLIIACANIAGAMLARSIFRRREIGIRVALGASGWRVTRQLLTEALVLSAAASVMGTIVGRLGIGLLTAGISDIPPWLHLGMDARGIVFAILIVAATSLVFGLAPSLQFRRQDLTGSLVGGTRTAGSLPERRTLNGLVVLEVALGAVLLACGGLLVRAYANLRDVDPGFRPDGVASFRLSLPDAKYRDGREKRRFYETLIARIARIPGVAHAGVVTCAPFSCHWGSFYTAEGAAPASTDAEDPVVLTRIASADYFPAMGIKLLHGHFFGATEGTPDGPRPAVINDLLAKRLWPTVEDPVGRRFTFRDDTAARDWMTVVGVVKDVRHYGLTRPMRPGMYMSLTSIDSARHFDRFAVVAQTSGDAASLFPALRAAVHELDPELPLFGVTTMRAALEASIASRRAIAMWLASFAAIALTLAIGGIYAVLSYVVGRRRHEIGIRMALGAQHGQVLRLVVRQGLRLVVIGLLLGVPAAYLASRVLSSLLVGVSARDPLTYLGVMVVLIATGLLAAWLPARRAAGVEPKIALGEGG
jgi:putative ABC transport system permease protein